MGFSSTNTTSIAVVAGFIALALVFVVNYGPSSTGDVVAKQTIEPVTASIRLTPSATNPLRAEATTTGAVAGVQFIFDGRPAGALDTDAPYQLAFNPAAIAHGRHTVQAAAQSTDGTTIYSALEVFEVQ